MTEKWWRMPPDDWETRRSDAPQTCDLCEEEMRDTDITKQMPGNWRHMSCVLRIYRAIHRLDELEELVDHRGTRQALVYAVEANLVPGITFARNRSSHARYTWQEKT